MPNSASTMSSPRQPDGISPTVASAGGAQRLVRGSGVRGQRGGVAAEGDGDVEEPRGEPARDDEAVAAVVARPGENQHPRAALAEHLARQVRSGEPRALHQRQLRVVGFNLAQLAGTIDGGRVHAGDYMPPGRRLAPPLRRPTGYRDGSEVARGLSLCRRDAELLPRGGDPAPDAVGVLAPDPRARGVARRRAHRSLDVPDAPHARGRALPRRSDGHAEAHPGLARAGARRARLVDQHRAVRRSAHAGADVLPAAG